MDSFHLMKVFVAVAEAEGFAAGARKLSMSPPAVTRAVAELENKLGVKLLNRTTRYVRVTDAGSRYLNDSKKILTDVQHANDAAVGINATPQGHLAITAPVLFGRMFVLPGVVDYLNKYPDTQVDALFLDRVVNLIEEGLDVAIRIGELPDSSMRALNVGAVRLILCASSKYIAEHGIPQQPSDLLSHTVISSRAVNVSSEWIFFEKNDGVKELNKNAIKIKLKPRLIVASNDAAIEATRQHLGITRLLSYQVAPYLASGELKIVLADYEPKPKPIHIVHRESHLTTAKVRAFIDLLADKLRKDKALN